MQHVHGLTCNMCTDSHVLTQTCESAHIRCYFSIFSASLFSALLSLLLRESPIADGNGDTVTAKRDIFKLSPQEFCREMCLPMEDQWYLRRYPSCVYSTFHNVYRYFRSRNVVDTYQFRDMAELERIGRMLRGNPDPVPVGAESVAVLKFERRQGR